MTQMLRPAVRPLATLLFAAAAASCGGSDTVGPDALRPELFDLALMDNQSLPAFAYTQGFGGQVFLKSARLVSVEPGRGADPRIFEDRTGRGGGGGSSRDSTTAAARMADIRVFEDRQGPTTVVGSHVDSTGVTVERRGDMVLIRRDHPDPARVTVDTGQMVNGRLLVRVREWERFRDIGRAVIFQYVVVAAPQ